MDDSPVSIHILFLLYCYCFISGSPKLYLWLLRVQLPCHKKTACVFPYSFALFIYLFNPNQICLFNPVCTIYSIIIL